jgi:hypothetical protein
MINSAAEAHYFYAAPASGNFLDAAHTQLHIKLTIKK